MRKLVMALVAAGMLGTLVPAVTWAASNVGNRAAAPLTRVIYVHSSGAEFHCADVTGLCGLGVG